MCILNEYPQVTPSGRMLTTLGIPLDLFSGGKKKPCGFLQPKWVKSIVQKSQGYSALSS